jgi:hypothetical protein
VATRWLLEVLPRQFKFFFASNVLAKIFRMLPLILADLDMRAKEMLINVLFTPEEKTFQCRYVTSN